MSKFKTAINILKNNPSKMILPLGRMGILNWMPDELYLKMIFKAKLGYELNLEHPVTYNEKLQWLKINDRKEIYSTMVDKYLVRNFVANIIGEEYLVPIYGVWENFDDIEFSELPDKFVLKCTHDSGSVLICKDKQRFDKKTAKRFFSKRIKKNAYYPLREWPYKNLKGRIIAEEYLEDYKTAELRDYKFYTFDGRVKAIMVNSGRNTGNTKAEYFDENFEKLNIMWGYKRPEFEIEKPKNFDLMLQLAECLAKNTIELRVDFYECNGQVYFGELTFFDGGGISPFEKYEWDKMFGDLIDLSNVAK